MSDNTERTDLVITILHYAQEHDLDINDKNEVREILKAIGSDLPDEEFEELMDQLKNADTFMDMSARDLTKKETKRPN